MEKTNRRAHGMTAQELIAKIQEAGFKARSYSGRCMFGKRCVGVVVGFDEDDWGIPRGNLLDSYALKQIWYWPDVAWPKDLIEVDEDDQQDDEDAQELH